MSKTCDRCKEKITKDLPKPGGVKFWGTVTLKTWRLRFNRLKMNTWEKAETAMDVIQSNTYSEIELCDGCWGDVLYFITSTSTKEKK